MRTFTRIAACATIDLCESTWAVKSTWRRRSFLRHRRRHWSFTWMTGWMCCDNLLMAKEKKFKFSVTLFLEGISSVSIVSGLLFVKVRLLKGGKYVDRSPRYVQLHFTITRWLMHFAAGLFATIQLGTAASPGCLEQLLRLHVWHDCQCTDWRTQFLQSENISKKGELHDTWPVPTYSLTCRRLKVAVLPLN